MGPHLGMSDLAHASAQPIPDQRTFVHNGLALEVLIAGERKRFSHSLERIDWLLLKARTFSRGSDHSLCLVSEVGRQFAVHFLDQWIIGNQQASAQGISQQLSAKVVDEVVLAIVSDVLPQALDAAKKQIPLGRAGTPREAAGGVMLFCFPESDYVTGQILEVAGGLPG